MSQPIIEQDSGTPIKRSQQGLYQVVRQSQVRQVGTPVTHVMRTSGAQVLHSGQGPQIVRTGSGGEVIRGAHAAQGGQIIQSGQATQGISASQRLQTHTSSIHQVPASNLKSTGRFQVQTSNIPVPADLPVPPPQRRLEYIPYEEKYVEYRDQVYYAPVQKVCTDYYQIQHVVEYVPIQKQETIMVTEPRQVINMKLQYVPVQHDKNAKQLGIKDYQVLDEKGIDRTGLYQPVMQSDYVSGEKPRLYSTALRANAETLVSQEEAARRLRRSNFVTSDNYNSQAHLREIDNLLSRSRTGEARS